MTRYQLHVEVEELEEGGYLAVCQGPQGCHAEGETVAEAVANVEDVARVIIELCVEKGLPLPPALQNQVVPPVFRGELVVKVGG
ncbi:MAG: type II toxin-antitoxin system HicB family antitoxin [Dehalococcoidia bacterium]|nr:type II toxin-antitoxin system HicB family antitoxin [Dehalococcoidia bacterium]